MTGRAGKRRCGEQGATGTAAAAGSPRGGDLVRMVGRNIQRLRTAAAMSQEDLARSARVNRAYLSGIECGIRNPSLLVLSDIAAGLNSEVADLFRQGHPAR